MTKGSALLGLSAIAMAAFGFAQHGREPTPTATGAAAPLPIETTVVEPTSSFLTRRMYTGVVKAARTSQLGFERTGRLIAVEVQGGERVVQGQLLARLDTGNLEAQRQELAAQRDAAASLLRELEAGPRRQTIAAARAEVRDLQAQAELAELNFKRREQLLQSQATSREEYDGAALGLQSTRAKFEAAARRLEELEEGTRPERIAAQRAAVAQLDAALANVAVDLADSELRAPFAGRIAERLMDEGTIVSPGAPLLRLVEDQRLEAWIGVPAELALKLNIGDAAKVFIEQSARDAVVKAILPELASATRTQTVILQLESAAKVFPAQLARLELDDTTQAEGFWVPTSALARGKRGLWSVLVAERGSLSEQLTAVRRDVEVLHTEGPRTLIRGTLQSGDRVIVSGAHRVTAGQRVAVSETTYTTSGTN